MKSKPLFVASLAALFLTSHVMAAHEWFRLTGVLTPGQPIQNVNSPLPLNQPITVTDTYLRIEVTRSGSGQPYEVLFGPDPITGGSATMKIVTSIIDPTYKDIYLESGILVMSGSRPYGGTQGGSATSDSSYLVVRKLATKGRFFYLDDGGGCGPMKVDNADKSDHKDVAVDHYVDVADAVGPITWPPKDILALSPKDPIIGFLWRVIDLGDQAGFTKPWP